MATIYTRASKGSALTWAEGDANIENLNNDKIEAVADDITPQLGGNLDVNGNSIVSVSNGDITIAPNGTGITVLQSDVEVGYGTARAAITSSGNYALDLVTNGGTNSGTITINPGVNANIEIAPNGTGNISLDGLLWPNADGTNNQVLKTNGSGVLSWVTPTDTNTTYAISAETTTGGVNLRLTGSDASTDDVKLANGSNVTLTRTDANTITIAATAGIATVSADTTPSLGGNLNVNGNQIVSASNGNISIQPNGTGQTVVKNLEYNENIFSLGTTSGTITPNVLNGNVQTITLNGNLTFSAFTSPVAGQSLTLIINTNGTGRTLTSTMKFAGGSKTLSTTNTTDIISVFYDGTNYWASLSTDFK